MIEVTGSMTKQKYYINPVVISTMRVEEKSTIIHLHEHAGGDYKIYSVDETPEDIIDMIVVSSDLMRRCGCEDF